MDKKTDDNPAAVSIIGQSVIDECWCHLALSSALLTHPRVRVPTSYAGCCVSDVDAARACALGPGVSYTARFDPSADTDQRNIDQSD